MEDRELTEQDIIDTTGAKDVGELEDLEILFKGFTNIGGLSRCTALRRVAFIDNGIKRISGLGTLGYTLLNLTLCDQEIRYEFRFRATCIHYLTTNPSSFNKPKRDGKS